MRDLGQSVSLSRQCLCQWFLHEGSGAVLVAGLAIGALEVLLAVVRVW